MGSRWGTVPSLPLAQRPLQETNGSGGAALASAAQLLAAFGVWLFPGGHSGTCARLMAAGWESLPGPRADKGEAGQSSSLLRMNL